MHQHLYVPLALAGQVRPSWWLIDTGSPWSFVGTEQAQRLARSAPGASERTVVVDGKTRRILANVEGTVNGNSLGRFDFFETYLGGLIDRMHNADVGYLYTFDTGGVLGVNFLAQRGASLDFRSQELFFALAGASSGSNRIELEKEGFTYVPIRITPSDRIEVIGSIGPDIYSFLIDSGSSKTVLQWAIKTANEVPVWYQGFVFFGFGQTSVRAATGRLASLKLGTEEVGGKIFEFANLSNLRGGFSHAYGGIIGIDLLWAHQAILDIGGRALYLKPAPQKRR
jgi:hypothetical protein